MHVLTKGVTGVDNCPERKKITLEQVIRRMFLFVCVCAHACECVWARVCVCVCACVCACGANKRASYTHVSVYACVREFQSKGCPKKRTRLVGSVPIYVSLHLKVRAKNTNKKKKRKKRGRVRIYHPYRVLLAKPSGIMANFSLAWTLYFFLFCLFDGKGSFFVLSPMKG